MISNYWLATGFRLFSCMHCNVKTHPCHKLPIWNLKKNGDFDINMSLSREFPTAFHLLQLNVSNFNLHFWQLSWYKTSKVKKNFVQQLYGNSSFDFNTLFRNRKWAISYPETTRRGEDGGSHANHLLHSLALDLIYCKLLHRTPHSAYTHNVSIYNLETLL